MQGIEDVAGFDCDEMKKGIFKNILPSIFYELDHISSKHGRQLQEHIADYEVCVCVCVFVCVCVCQRERERETEKEQETVRQRKMWKE